jgi:hypothetical protein
MMTWFYKHRFAFFIGTAVIFLGGMFAGFGSYIFLRSPQDTAIKVNDATISMEQFQRAVDQIAARNPKTPSEADLVQIKKAAVQELIREEAFWQEAERYGIHVVDPELAAAIETIPAFKKEGRFDQGTYIRALRYNLHITPEQFEAAQRKDLAFRKFQLLINLAIHIPKTEFPEASQWALSTIKDSKEQQKIAKDPKALNNLIHNAETNQVMGAWLNYLNGQLRVKIVSSELKNL